MIVIFWGINSRKANIQCRLRWWKHFPNSVKRQHKFPTGSALHWFLMFRLLPGYPESQEVTHSPVDGEYCQIILLSSVHTHWELQHFCLFLQNVISEFKAALQLEHTAPPARSLHHSSNSPEKILGGRAGVAPSEKTEQKPSHSRRRSGLVPSISAHLYYLSSTLLHPRNRALNCTHLSLLFPSPFSQME